MRFEGRCFCGEITWSSDVAPIRNLICHCRDCQRALSAPFMATLGFGRGEVIWHGRDAITAYQSSATAERGFCKKCGTRLYYLDTRWPEEEHVMASTLINQNDYQPSAHVMTDETAPWYPLLRRLPGHAGFGKNPHSNS